MRMQSKDGEWVGGGRAERGKEEEKQCGEGGLKTVQQEAKTAAMQ